MWIHKIAKLALSISFINLNINELKGTVFLFYKENCFFIFSYSCIKKLYRTLKNAYIAIYYQIGATL